MSQRATLHITIVTAQSRVYDGEADAVNAPGGEGRLTILPRHAPLLTTLSLGELRVRHAGVEEGFFVAGGFLEVNNNVVTILADDAERASDIDEEHAEAARKRAQELLAHPDTSGDLSAIAAAELERAVGRLKVAEIHRNRGGRRRQPTEQEI